MTDWVIQSLLGSTIELGNVHAWDDVGDILPSTVANVFSQAFLNVEVQALTVGQVVCFPADDMQWIGQNPANGPSQWLKCEGQIVANGDYPDLFAVIGYSFGGVGSLFHLPDLRGLVIVGAGNGPGLTPRNLADMGGEEKHTLSSGEMPSHYHAEGNATPTVVTAGAGAPVPSAIPSVGITGSAGGSGAHNNMQPFNVLFYYIQAVP